MKKFLLAVCFLVGACATEAPDPETTSPEELYNYAADLLIERREYTRAAEAFDTIDRYYPYSRWAMKGQIMAAFADYVKKDYDDAEVLLERFISLYPGNRYAPYAYYLKAMCDYARLSDPRRDQARTEDALKALNEVAARFPDTPYAEDARKKMILAADYLAAHELNVGRAYEMKSEHAAALNRFEAVVRRYPETRSVQEALYRMTEVFLTLGLDEQARKSAAVLGFNYPDSPWYARAYALIGKHAPHLLSSKG